MLFGGWTSTLNMLLLIAFAFSLGINIGMYSTFHHVDMSLLSRLSFHNFDLSSHLHQKSKGDTNPTSSREELLRELPPAPTDLNSIRNNHRDQEPINTGTTVQTLPKITNDLQPSDINLATATPLLQRAPLVVNEAGGGPISRFLAAGGLFPIVLVTCDRTEYLKQTIESLKTVRALNLKNVLISQDGVLDSIASVAKQYDIQLVQNTRGNVHHALRLDGANKIATHYKFSLSQAFEKFPEAPAVIVIEDDLLFSPDFYEYFLSNAPVMDSDTSVLALSAWNDNGFIGKVGGVYDLLRTTFFPGLGWLLSRSLYKNELEAQWPQTHW